MPEFLETAQRIIKSGRYVGGPEISAFEQALSKLCGTQYCIAVSNGLDALRLILKGYIQLGKLREGDEVIVPANTFIATFLAVTDCGLTAVAADVDEATFCLDFSRLPLSEKTKAVIIVHLFGYPCWNVEEIEKLRKKGILIIEDNAQAIGASFAGQITGSLGDAAAISFYPAKNIGAFGDAGAVLTDNKDLANTVRALANYGSHEKYHHVLCGLNCRMDALQAALLSIKLKNIDDIIRRRNASASLYDRLITNKDVLKPTVSDQSITHVWHQYVIRHKKRDDLRQYLAENGIGTEIHYPVCCHLQPCYKGNPLLKVPLKGLPMSEQISSEILSLPIADVTEQEIRRIANAINSFS